METIFSTDDIQLAAFFLTQGIQIMNIESDYKGHYLFSFSPSNRCLELKIQFLNNASAPARELFAQRDMLISEIKTLNIYGTSKNVA